MIYKRGFAFSLVLIFTALSLTGWFFVPMLSVRFQPSATLPSLNISCYWPNASANNVEARITSKIESSVNTLKGIKKINSVSSPARASIDIAVDKFTDPDKLRLEVSSLLRRVYPSLPQGASYPHLRMNYADNQNEKPLMTYTLNGPVDNNRLKKLADNAVKANLAMIKGVNSIEIYGGLDQQWNIIFNQNLCNILDISRNDIKNAISGYFKKTKLGRSRIIENGEEKIISVKLENNDSGFTGWGDIPIKKIDERIIHLSDIARFEKSTAQATSYFRINGRNALNIVIYPDKGVNTLELAKKIRKKETTIKHHLPHEYQLSLSYDSTEYVGNELNKIYRRTLFTLLILLIFVFLVSFNFKYVLLIVLSLFTNISIAFILYYSFKIEIHLYSLAGITVSLGLIIDNSIVMADHLIYRKNIKIFTALLASTLTTIVSLIIVWFLPEKLRLNLWDFALIIVINLMVSLLVSLFYIPALVDLMNFRRRKSKSAIRILRIKVLINNFYLRFIKMMMKYRRLALLILLLSFGLPVFLLPVKLDGDSSFVRIYNASLGSEWYVDNARPLVNKYLGGSLRLFSFYVFENSYYSKHEETKLYVNASLPKGATLEQMNVLIMDMEKYLLNFSDKINFVSRINSPQYASIEISFKNTGEAGTFPWILKSKLIGRTIDKGGVDWDVYGIGKGFSNSMSTGERMNFKVHLKGYNYYELEKIALKLEKKLKEHPRIKKVNIAAGKYWWNNSKSYEFFAQIDKEKLPAYNLNTYDIYSLLEKGSAINNYKWYQETGNDITLVNLKANRQNPPDVWEIMNSPGTKNGLKASAFVNIVKQEEQQEIYKENQSYLRIVDFQYIGTERFGKKYLNKVLDELRAELPAGYSAEPVQSWYNFKEQSIPYTLLILLIAVIIFVLCSILFESLTRPFAILLTVPASFIGVFLTFYLFDLNFDQGGYASFVLITGLVVNAAIYILNDLDNLRKQSPTFSVYKLYLKAFNHKIVPILLTILSTVLGLIPFVAGGQNEVFWFALAAGTMGGLLFSILIIVVYLPVFALKKKDVL